MSALMPTDIDIHGLCAMSELDLDILIAQYARSNGGRDGVLGLILLQLKDKELVITEQEPGSNNYTFEWL